MAARCAVSAWGWGLLCCEVGQEEPQIIYNPCPTARHASRQVAPSSAPAPAPVSRVMNATRSHCRGLPALPRLTTSAEVTRRIERECQLRSALPRPAPPRPAVAFSVIKRW